MKNTFRFIGSIAIITIATVIVFSVIACKDDEGDLDTSGFLGDSLDLSGQVVYWEWDDEAHIVNYTGNLSIDCEYGGSGEIKNGQFSYSIGIPIGLQVLDFEDEFGWGFYEEITSNKTNVKGVIISRFNIINDEYYSSLFYSDYTAGIEQSVDFIYVDTDVTVNGKGMTYTGFEEEGGYSWIETAKDFSLAFKAGWNALYIEEVETTSSYSITMTLSNPPLRWFISK